MWVRLIGLHVVVSLLITGAGLSLCAYVGCCADLVCE